MSFFPLFPSALISTYQQIFHKPLPESAVFVQSDTASACQCGSTDRPLLAVSGPSRQELCRTWSSPAGTVLYLVLPVRVCAVPGPLRQGLCRAGPTTKKGRCLRHRPRSFSYACDLNLLHRLKRYSAAHPGGHRPVQSAADADTDVPARFPERICRKGF